MQKLPGDTLCGATKQLSTQRLAKSAREPQISRLRASHNSCGGSTIVYVYGPRSTGKTVTVRAFVARTVKAACWVDCARCERSSDVLGKLLAQLKNEKHPKKFNTNKKQDQHVNGTNEDNQEETFQPTGRVSFLDQLQDLLPKEGHAMFFVLDNVQHIADTAELAVLLNAKKSTGVSLGIIIISTASPRCMFEVPQDLIAIEFPAYSPVQLTQIFVDMRTEYDDKKHRDERHWQNFLQCVADLSRISNSIDDLEAVLDELWPLYCLPLEKGQDLGFAGHYDLFWAKYNGVRQKFTANYTKMKCSLLTMKAWWKTVFERFTGDEKLLLLATYLAARVSPSMDVVIWSLRTVRRKRRSPSLSSRSAVQVTALEKALAAGPKPVVGARMYMWFLELGEGYAHWWKTKSFESLDEVAKEEYIQGLQETALQPLVAHHHLTEVPPTAGGDPRYICEISDEQAAVLAGFWPDLDLTYFLS